MAKINNTTIYPIVGGSVKKGKTAIGTDWEDVGKTVNIPLDGGDGYQNNLVVVHLLQHANSENIPLISDLVNGLSEFQIGGDEIYVFSLVTGIIKSDFSKIANPKTHIVITENHWLFKGGRGVYGVGGTTVFEKDFFWLRGSELTEIVGENPVVYYMSSTDIESPHDVLNASEDEIIIESTQDVYFFISEFGFEDTKRSNLYRFVGADGSYGINWGQSALEDFLLIERFDDTSVQSSKLGWLDLVSERDIIPFPKMNKRDMLIVRIFEQGSAEPVPNGWATIGGWDGVRIGHMAMLICMQDSDGGTYAEVGHKYAIVANYTTERQIITVADHASLPDEGDAILGVLYLTLDTGNLYYFDAVAGDYMLVGSIVEGTLISDTEFEDINNNPVVPDGSHLYKDVGSGMYYKWDGVKFIEFSQGGGGVVTESSLLLDSTYPELEILLDAERFQRVFNQRILRATRIEKTVTESVTGTKKISLAYPAGHYSLTMTGATTIEFEDMIDTDETTVSSMTVSGNYPLTLPGFLEKSESSDDYEGSKMNEFVFNIKSGGVSPAGYYTITNYEI